MTTPVFRGPGAGAAGARPSISTEGGSPKAPSSGGEEQGGGTSTVPLSVATLLKNLIGAGIFSLPIGLKFATPVPGLFILGSIGLMSAVSYWMVGYCCYAWNVSSFRKLWHRALGANSAWVIDVTILGNGWFTLVGYLVLIGDFTTKSFEGLLGKDSLLARSRLLDQWAITLLVLLPLSMQQDLSKLAFTSVLGLGVTTYVVVLVLRDAWLNSPPEWGSEIVLAEWRPGAFQAIALYTHAFVAHYNAPKMYSELERPTAVRWLTVIIITYGITFFIYAAFALAGLRRFENDVLGNVLRNFESQLSVLVAWLGMGFSIAFTYPMVFNSMREACVNLMSPIQEQLLASPRLQRLIASPKKIRGPFRSNSLYNVLGPRPAKVSQGKNTATTVVLVLMTAIVASFLSDLGLVNALAGSIMGCAVAYIFPGLIFLYTVLAQIKGGISGTPSPDGDLDTPLLGQREKFSVRASTAPKMLLLAGLVFSRVIMVSGVCFAVLGLCVALQNARAEAGH